MGLLLWVWTVAGVFSFLALIVSCHQMYRHVTNYHRPVLQRKIMGILWMVPIYAISSWLSLRFVNEAIYLDMIRDCYEAYVIYLFLALMVAYIGHSDQDHEYTNEDKVLKVLEIKTSIAHPWPFSYCFRPLRCDRSFLRACKAGTLQFVVLKPATALMGIFLEWRGVLDEGHMRWDRGYLYLSIVRNFSVTLSMYFLVLFYMSTKEALTPYKPVPKFLCIKSVLFFSFWQSVAIAILVKLDIIHEAGAYTTENVSVSIQNVLICFEMFLAALAHTYAFSYKEFEVGGMQAKRRPLLRDVFDVSDVLADFNEISPVVLPTGFQPKVVAVKSRDERATKRQTEEYTRLV